MTKNEKKTALIAGVVLLTLICAVLFVALDPVGRGLWNARMFAVQKVDDATRYSTKKEVEDTCRAMVSSYEADKLTYSQYKDSESAEKQSWAEQAKMRANKTASTYNNYVLENSFVFDGNIPKDIMNELPYLD